MFFVQVSGVSRFLGALVQIFNVCPLNPRPPPLDFKQKIRYASNKQSGRINKSVKSTVYLKRRIRTFEVSSYFASLFSIAKIACFILLSDIHGHRRCSLINTDFDSVTNDSPCLICGHRGAICQKPFDARALAQPICCTIHCYTTGSRT